MEGVTTRQITEAAEQRNTSAVSYHFGSRDGLLRAILARRGGPVDEERGRLLTGAGADPTLDDLVRSLVVPYAALLDDPGGRAYLRIVAQLRGRFSAWREASDASTTQHLAAILERVEAIPDAPPAVRRERVLGLIMLLTGMVAERARRIDDGTGAELDHAAFVADLTAMAAAVVTAETSARP